VGDPVAWAYEPDPWRRHLVMIGSSGFVVIALLLAAIAWIFRQPDKAKCRADFVCLVNVNAGLIALYGIVLGTAAAFIVVAIRAADEEEEQRRFDRVRRQAVYEAWHNLQHFARSCKQHGHMINRADISLERAIELASHPLAKRLSPSEAEYVDHMRRNLEVLRRLPWDDDSEAAKRHAEWFVEQALRLAVAVALEDEVARNMIRDLRIRRDHPEDEREALKRPLIELAQALRRGDTRWTIQFDYEQPLNQRSGADCHVVCWQSTLAESREVRHVLGAALGELADPP
jgi:hypothetical protein